MKGLYLVLAGLLVLVVAIAGCVGKQATSQPVSQPAQPPVQQPPAQQAAPVVEGDITVPADSGMSIEQPQSSSDETVDLGSLI